MSLELIRDCKYITSVGMLKNLDENNIINYVKEPWLITHDFNHLINNGKENSTVYIKFAFFREFVYNILPRINFNFTLITGDGDETMPFDLIDNNMFNQVINNPRIKHWYSVNCLEHIHPKLTLIPIGVNFHSLSFGEFCGWNNEAQTPLEQESIIDTIKLNSKPFYEREIKCYSNFHFVKHNEFGNPRQDAINKIPSDLIYYEPNLTNRYNTWLKQSEYSFVVSPMGHGMDCHRTWEALILGCIVIVKKSVLDSLYEGLPVLIVNDWSDITQELLINTVNEFKNKEFNYERITAKYWLNKIRNNE